MNTGTLGESQFCLIKGGSLILKIIKNISGETVQEVILANFPNDIFQIAAPFFTWNAVLKKIIDDKVTAKIIVRLCNATSIEALEKSLNSPNIQIKYFIEQDFHSKLYIVDDRLAIIGSSNFTNGGLLNNIELNVQINKNDTDFNEINAVFNEYWEKAENLDKEILDIYVNEFKCLYQDTFDEKLLLESFKERLELYKDEQKQKRKSRILSEVHKQRIGEANRGKARASLSDERKEQLREAVSQSLSKPVVCLNTKTTYSSLSIAALEVYSYERGYGYIAEVCKGRKKHYKHLIWRFEEDYLNMKPEEISTLLNELTRMQSRNTKIKEYTKLSFRGKTYDVQFELGRELMSLGFTKNERSVSALIKQSQNNGCSFMILNKEYIYFCNYIKLYKGSEVIEDQPVNTSIEELIENLTIAFSYGIEDANCSEILSSFQESFFCIENKFYKSKNKLQKDNNYDKILSKEESIELYRNNKNQFIGSLNFEKLLKTTRTKFYYKNDYLFASQNDYVDLFSQTISKENLLIEIGIDPLTIA